MQGYRAIVGISLVALFFLVVETEAAGRRSRRAWRDSRPAAPQQPHRFFWNEQLPTTHEYHKSYDYYDQWYPKYYGGLHSSVILRNGYPGNDARLRGYAW